MTWNVTEITLEARWVGHDPDTLILSCRSISELPAEYYPDTIGADETVMRNEKERRSLVVRGISPQALEALKWMPTDLSFRDSRTGQLKNFLVESVSVPEPGTARFAILN